MQQLQPKSKLVDNSQVLLVADPVDDVLYRKVEGLQQSYYQLLEQAQLFSLNICELLKPRLKMKLQPLADITVERPTLSDFAYLTDELTAELKRIESLVRIALCDQDSQEMVMTRRHNDDIVVDCCSAVKELADMYCGGHLAVDQQRQQWLRGCFTKLYRLLEYNTEDQQVLTNLKLRLPKIGESRSRPSSRGSLSSRTKPTSVVDWREQCRQEISENNILKEEIARLQDMQTHMRSEYYQQRAPVEASHVQCNPEGRSERIDSVRRKLDELIDHRIEMGKPLNHNYTFKRIDTPPRRITQELGPTRLLFTEPSEQYPAPPTNRDSWRLHTNEKSEQGTLPSFHRHVRQKSGAY